MLHEIFREAWAALQRNCTRSFLTMSGIVWGIVAVTMLISYGSAFRVVLVHAFEAFGRDAVICWPQQTSEQPGGQRAGQKVRLEQADVDALKESATLVKHACLESVRWKSVTYHDRLVNTATRGVCPEYGEMRNELPRDGRWITPMDLLERRHVVFLGGRVYERLFAGRPAVDETVQVDGLRFLVVGVMARKMQLSNYFTSDDDSAFIPYSVAGDLWETKDADVLVFEPITPRFEKQAMQQVRSAIAERQRFSPSDQKAIQMFGREEFRPVVEGITIGLEVLLMFIGTLTLGIGGVGVMNIMLVSVDERIREIGLRRALGARRRHILFQFLAETLLLMLAGGMLGIVLAYGLSVVLPVLPLLGPMFEDTSGQGDIHLTIHAATMMLAMLILVLVGVVSGLVPAMRASKLDPMEALRYE